MFRKVQTFLITASFRRHGSVLFVSRSVNFSESPCLRFEFVCFFSFCISALSISNPNSLLPCEKKNGAGKKMLRNSAASYLRQGRISPAKKQAETKRCYHALSSLSFFSLPKLE
ncbi:hypothetical protein [Holdemania sp. Marseille-P2844]|uniref:hypothetical protein n=1 Tax=Holdemania sp. Marseille-P2844 TaxID=1852366 RepID=UPI001114860D|nr:hypothetical protein [Holdemania sp. Marseille-P2844]